MKQKFIILLALTGLSGFVPLDKDLNEYGKWLKYHNLKDEDFDQTGTAIEKKIIWNDYNLKEDDIKLFNSFFLYSSDSSHFIDLDSYSLAIEKDTNGQLISYGSDVDIRVQLVKNSKMKAADLLFCGTLCYPETAIWRNNSWLEIFGFKIGKDGKFIPTIWKVDINNMLFTEYSNKKRFNNRPESYSQNVRLNKIKFKY